MLRRGFVARLFRSVVVASLTWIGCISEEPDTPPPPPSGQDAPPEPPPLANPVLTDVFMSVSSAINMPNGMGVGISAAVSCRPGTPITGDRIYSDAERTVYATIEPGGEGDPFTIVSETGSCVVRADGWARLQVVNERNTTARTCPIGSVFRGCDLGSWRALAIWGEVRASWTPPRDMRTERVDSFADLGLSRPWKVPLREELLFKRELADGYSLIEARGAPEDPGSGRGHAHLWIVMHEGLPLWYEVTAESADFLGLVVVDDEQYLLFAGEVGAWMLRAVRDGQTRHGFWP